MVIINEDLTGRRFDRLIARHRALEWKPRDSAYWVCECDCGGWIVTSAGRLRHRNNRSCGCLGREHSKRQMAVINATASADWRSLLATLRSEVIGRHPRPPREIKETLRDVWGECQDRRFWRALRTLVDRGQIVRSGKSQSSEEDIGSVYSLPRQQLRRAA